MTKAMEKGNPFITNFVYPLIVGLILAWVTYSFFSSNNNEANKDFTNSRTLPDTTIIESEPIQDTTIIIAPSPKPKIAEKPTERESARKITIISTKTQKRDYKIENYLNQIVQEQNLKNIVITGNSSIQISSNKTVQNQLRLTIELDISINNKSISIPLLYGRGDNEIEAFRHALEMNKDLITNKMIASI